MTAAYIIDPKLKDFGTPTQVRYVDLVNLHGGLRAAERAEKIGNGNGSTIGHVLKNLRENAAARGYAPDHGLVHEIPAPFVAKGYSTLRDAGGNVVMQWEKTKLDDQLRAQAIMQAFATAAEPLPRVAPVPAPKHTLPDLLNLYTFTDWHLGMRAWAKESGTDWTLQKSEAMLTQAFTYMVEHAPKAGTAFINQLGDFFHTDSLLPMTPTSGHVLDQGAQYAEMVEAGVRVLRRLINAALRRHDKVVVLMAEGNHDLASSVWLRVMMRALYENEPRVEVLDTAQPFYAYQFGTTMLGFHHGHKVKNEALPALFSARYRLMWGTSTRVYIHVGHRHHLDQKDLMGARVVQHPTLAAADSHTSREGYDLEQREAQVFTYHSRLGQVASTVVTPQMLEAA